MSLADTYNLHDLRHRAQAFLPRGMFEFVDRGAEDERAVQANRRAFDSIRLYPRGLVNVENRSQAIELLGARQAMPVVVAPTGVAGLLRYQGELSLARAAAAADIPFTLSVASITPMEDIAQSGARLWFQMYMWPQPEMSYRLAERAWAAGCRTLVLTIDSVAIPNREFNHRNGFGIPVRLNRRNAWDLVTHPRWLLGVMGRYLAGPGMPGFANYPPEMMQKISANPRLGQTLRNERFTWAQLAPMRERWKGRLVVKGILHPQDAELAVAAGADAIVVSNHGGRNFDSAPTPLSVLPAVVRQVAGRAAVLVDGGFMRGSDVLKAIALGAQGVLLGRAPLYGLAAGGQAGVAHALQILHTEIDRGMAFMGCKMLADVDHHCLVTSDEQAEARKEENHE